MDGFMGHQLICRACLRIVENKTQSFGFIEDANGNLKDMIMCCVPEMDIYVSSNPIMCFPCIQLLVNVYNFKTRCLNTETIIRSYIQRNNLVEYNHVNLSCVVQELIRLNNYFREAYHRRIDTGKQSTGCCPQNPNGIPKIPYGIPHGAVPGDHFRLSESQERLDNAMDHEAVPENQVMGPVERRVQGDVSPDENRNQIFMENQFVPKHRVMRERFRMFKSLPISPTLKKTEDTLIKAQYGLKDRTAPSQDAEEHKILENQNIEHKKDIADSSNEHHPKCQSDKHESEDEASDDSEETEKKGEESPRAQSEGSHDETKKTAASQDNIKDSSLLKLQLQKDSVMENRPRLIIKICKNKITIPSNKNEDSNEKENEGMDVDANKTEMPPPEAIPLEFNPSQDNNGQELYQCSSCTFVTTHLNYYATHRKICHSELNDKKCPHCPHVTNRKYALNKHINTMHTKSVWYTCDFCPYRSTDSSCLRRHKRNVHPERLGTDLMCQSCSYRCTTEYHLKKHMIKHEDSAALQCQFCSYSTRDRSNFRKHVFIHNPKPHDCEFCDYKCVSPYQMKLHLKKLHHGVGMEDVDCRSEVSISEVVQDISAAIREAKNFVGHQTD